MIKTLLTILLTVFIYSSFAVLPEYAPVRQDNQIVDDSVRNDLLVYPNPVESGRVTLEIKSGEISEVRLINILGKDVIYSTPESGYTKYILSLGNLPDGIYFVRVKSSENNIVVKKLVVASR